MKSKRLYCCNDNKYMIEDYYKTQVGSGLPHFSGSKYQKGHGIGNMLKSVMKTAIPLLKKSGKEIGKNLLSTGMDIANDVISGKSIKDSSKQIETNRK